MALDAEDRARLARIETWLADDDPALVERFRSWRPPAGGSPMPAGSSMVPGWALLVFLVGFTTWMVAPVVGVVIALLSGVGWFYVRAARRVDPGRARRRR